MAQRYSHRRCFCSATQSQPPDLKKYLTARIAANGPMSVAEYMKEVLTNPISGYYMHKNVIGRDGDFITSPEVSQMFGELLGIWCINEWVKAGMPPTFQLVELGPGRGTLADDMLRTFAQFPTFGDKVSLHMVEISPKLSQQQEEKLTGNPGTEVEADVGSAEPPYKTVKSRHGPEVKWYKDLREVPEGFSCYIAHEFFDALPIFKFHKTQEGWREVLVDLNTSKSNEDEVATSQSDSDFRYVIAGGPTFPARAFLKHIQPEDPRNHLEVSPVGGVVISELAKRIAEEGGFSLIIDYGHNGDKTDTFRAFKNHKQHDALKDPGTADLTADVDFSYLRSMAESKVKVFGPVTQKDFLHNMGILARLQMLMNNCKDEKRSKILLSEYEMLTHPDKMGSRFQFLALLSGDDDDKDYVPSGFINPSEHEVNNSE
ncbi:protein arginine methyltransferase NDUFAF7, mitochondrial-like isoform X2 [Mizuhopecten yessoensis]|uniref:protein arginine methyltransferase NDUFAF7, mitochondrial-like isoform X2 n=1 Tax=Mizuhopecten yessoensis TaxID=6573 RepID=UPI000B459326|nr:protein arginine methyltransferase NDUFAF7, mitochondrial-like isoform X2 [Mizuhopecten yessoensis]